jgi:hypothetical protein
LLLHRSFTNVNRKRMALLDHDAPAVDRLGGDDDAAAPPIRDVDVYGRGASGPRRDAAGELGEV